MLARFIFESIDVEYFITFNIFININKNKNKKAEVLPEAEFKICI